MTRTHGTTTIHTGARDHYCPFCHLAQAYWSGCVRCGRHGALIANPENARAVKEAELRGRADRLEGRLTALITASLDVEDVVLGVDEPSLFFERLERCHGFARRDAEDLGERRL